MHYAGYNFICITNIHMYITTIIFKRGNEFERGEGEEDA